MTNHESSHRFRNHLRALPPEPPGGHIMIGQAPPQPQGPTPMLMVIDGMATALLNGPDLAGAVVRLQVASAMQPGGETPKDVYVSAIVDVFAKAQAAVRTLHAAERARLAIPAVEMPEPNGSAKDAP